MTPNQPHPTVLSRRQLLKSAGAGFGYLALAGLIAEAADQSPPMTLKGAHFPAKAKRIIFLFMQGAM
jgi:hypothetical protein